MPIINIKILEGRDEETKKRMAKEVTDAVENSIGAPRHTIRVIIQEIPAHHWAIGGTTKDEL